MGKWGKISLCGIALFFLGLEHALAQTSNQEPNRLSMGMMGAATTGHLNVGSAFQSGVNANFEFQEQLNTTLGFNLRYVATPEIALQTNVVFGRFSILSDIFPDDALSFDNNYITTSLTTQLSLVRLFGASAENFNLFGSFGTGLMFNDVSINSENPAITQSDVTPANHPFQTFFTTFGGGIRFNLGHRLDSYAQYEYSSASRDIIDGNFIGELLELGGSSKISNSWSAVTFGIQFKFGSGNVDADWPTVTRIVIPEPPPEKDMFERLEELLARQADIFMEEIDQLTGRIDSLELALLEEKQKNQELVKEEPAPQNEEMAEMIRELQQKVESLENALAEERAEADKQPVIAEDVQVPDDASRTERPKNKAIQRVRIQGEMIVTRQIPRPLPVEIVLVPDVPDESDGSETVFLDSETVEEITEAQPQPQEEVEQEEITSPEDDLIRSTQKTEVDLDSALESDNLAVADNQKTGTVEESREDIIRKADSLRVIQSIREFDSSGQGMSSVQSDVTTSDTADIATPKPEEKEPEQPKPDFKEDLPDKEESETTIARADLEPEDADEADKITDEAETDPVNRSDTDSTFVNTPEKSDEIAQTEQETAEQPADAIEEPDEDAFAWTWYALIAVAVLGAVYIVVNKFKPKSGTKSGSDL